MFKIAVLVSGNGTNLQAIIDHYLNNPDIKISLVISNKADAYALKRASLANIPTMVISKKDFPNQSDEILKQVKANNIDLIVLAGYLSILSGSIINEYKNKIINIHPSLIPAFCGPGMYGHHVHEAVIKSGVRYSGCTVHFVNGGVDSGPIILQQAVDVFYTDTPDSVAAKILVYEHKLLVKTIDLIANNKVIVHDNNRVEIKK
ncbi:MAG: phosphoribosylglycinamide formyltransferase [Mycoplasmataceae bacterium]|nr:phosphoribosylglycinamide formyltransferase [Mycoplasmataceae bacterium]